MTKDLGAWTAEDCALVLIGSDAWQQHGVLILGGMYFRTPLVHLLAMGGRTRSACKVAAATYAVK